MLRSDPEARHYIWGMHLPNYLNLAQNPRRVSWVLGIAWIFIALKCVAVTWAVDHWHMPFHAGWITAPTVAFAALATVLWMTHREE